MNPRERGDGGPASGAGPDLWRDFEIKTAGHANGCGLYAVKFIPLHPVHPIGPGGESPRAAGSSKVTVAAYGPVLRCVVFDISQESPAYLDDREYEVKALEEVRKVIGQGR